MNENELSKIIIDAAFEVHRESGRPGLRLGLVINFGERLLKAGIHRVVHGLPEDFRL